MNEILEVVWSQSIETAAVKAQQQPASRPTRSHAPYDVVLTYLADHPRATMRDMHAATGLSMQDLNRALYGLEQQGRVARSHWQRDNRLRPVEWRLR